MSALFDAGVGLAVVSAHWCESRDGCEHARALFDRHYSRYIYRDGRRPKLFVGPGEKMVLITPTGDALFVWRRFISADQQDGINCAIFRNESRFLASDLIREAEAAAWMRWGATPLHLRQSTNGPQQQSGLLLSESGLASMWRHAEARTADL